MNIAFVCAAPDSETALARRMRYLAELFADRGHDVRVLCTRWWDGEYEEFEREGVTYRAVSGSKQWFVPRLPGVLSDVRPEIVHVGGSEPSAALAARFSGTRVILEWCGEESPRLLDRAFSTADRVCVPSEHVRTKVRERGADATVVPEGIPTEAVRAADPAGSAALVWTGRLDEYAGLEGLLLALAEGGDREWRTLVIGEGPERGRYERLARDLRIERRVDFAGRSAVEDRIGLLKGAHVFVHTADRCPFASDLLLALWCGCVGIVEYQPDSAAHELVAGYDRGIAVTDEEELVDAIEAAAEFPHESYDSRFERFSNEAVFERYLGMHRTLGVLE